MKRIKNKGRYISTETLSQCFDKGKHLKVDKGITGNGFTTAFMNAKVPQGKKNILIMLNRGAIEDKERGYKKIGNKKKNKIAFVYSGSKDTLNTNANLYIIIIDKFIIDLKYFFNDIENINWILIDESHTLKTDSVFRKRLKGFDDKIEPFLINDRIAVTSVTASPMLYTKSDIFIENENLPEIVINVSPDRTRSIENAIEDLRSEESVLIATNSKSVIYRFKDENNVLRANFHIGDKLMQSLLPMMKIIPDSKSKLTIISKKSFEGIDLHGPDYSVYFFEDRGKGHESFFVANLYQAISRVRTGAIWMEYSRREFKGDVVDVELLEKKVDSLVARRDLSVENKQGSKFKVLQNYLIFERGNGKFKVKKDKIAFDLLKEKIEYDKGFDAFTDFFQLRNVKINFLDEIQLPVKRERIFKETRLQNLTSNYKFIRSSGIYNDDKFRLPTFSYGDIVKDLKMVEGFLMLKRYDWHKKDIENEDRTRPLKPREEILLELFSNSAKMNKLLKEVTTAYNKSRIAKDGFKNSIAKREKFKNRAPEIVHKICLAFGNNKISVPEKIVGYRDYNIFTEISMTGIKIIAERFGIEVLEIDIKNAYPRIMYALNRMELPDNFYGTNKKNKLSINIAINNFRFNSTLNTVEAQQRSDSRKKLRKLGFHEKVVDDLMVRFFNSPHKGDLFNYLASYEKQIIDKVMAYLIHETYDGYARRHDSVLYFNHKGLYNSKSLGIKQMSETKLLGDFEFKGVKGWFDV